MADETPVIGIVSRFAAQKGFDLVEQIAGQADGAGRGRGGAGDGRAGLREILPRLGVLAIQGEVAVQIRYDEALAHKIEAGADIFLMPSRYEPCGLNQMYSLKYGTVPVVRATGGLDDTIEEWNPEAGNRNGFQV